MHDLIPPEHIEAAKGYFKATIARAQGRIGTGFIGTPALLPALVKIGEPELAAAVFLQEEVPGWLYQVKRGATTIWERWDAIKADGSIFDPQMNSYNHYAYGAVCQWLFEGVAGFRPDPNIPGFKNIIFEPTIVPALSPVAASHDSISGRVEAAWDIDGDRVTYRLRVPDGSRGTLVLSPLYSEIRVDDQDIGWSGGAEGNAQSARAWSARCDVPDQQIVRRRAGRRWNEPSLRLQRLFLSDGRERLTGRTKMLAKNTRRSLLAASAGLALTLGLAGAGFAADPVTLTYFVDDNPTNVATAEGLKAAFEKENPDIKIDIETHPGGSEGDNLVKTRLATGEMSDVFRYNAGSLFRALNPPQNMLDLSNEPYISNIIDSFKPVVSVDGKIYGVPEEAAMGGGILYNRKIYADLGLSVPKSWAEFMANNAKDQGGRQGAGDPDLRRHLDQPALRPRRLLQRPVGRSELRRRLHRQQGEVCCRSGGNEGL